MVPCQVMSRMGPPRVQHRCDGPCQARMNSAALSMQQGHVCVARLQLLYHGDLTDCDSVNRVSQISLPTHTTEKHRA